MEINDKFEAPYHISYPLLKIKVVWCPLANRVIPRRFRYPYL